MSTRSEPHDSELRDSELRDSTPPLPAHLVGLLELTAGPEPGSPAVLPLTDLVGSLVVEDRRLPALLDGLADGPTLPVTVAVTGGAGALTTLPRWFRDDRLRLRAVECAVRDLDDLVGGVRRIAAAARQASYDLPEEVPVHVELPLPFTGTSDRSWASALDELAAEDLAGVVRLGGGAAGPPTAADLAAVIEAHLDREVPFRATGPCDAVHGSEGELRHGVLNLLLATRVSLDGEDPVRALATADEAAVARWLGELGGSALARARRWFTAAGWPSAAPYDAVGRLGGA